MTLDELKNKIQNLPVNQIFTREEFNKFVFGGETVLYPNAQIVCSMNYQYLNPKKVQVKGVILYVYIDHFRCETVLLDQLNLHNAENLINQAIEKAKQQCLHNGPELTQEQCKNQGIPHYGMCWHVYKCQKCGEIYTTDSSD